MKYIFFEFFSICQSFFLDVFLNFFWRNVEEKTGRFHHFYFDIKRKIMTENNNDKSNSTMENISTNMEITELSKLFSCLIEICSKKSNIDEQQTISQIIQPIFTKNIENSPSFYRFLNPLANTPKKVITKKKNNVSTTNGPKNKVGVSFLNFVEKRVECLKVLALLFQN